MKCPKCQYPIPDDSVFCQYCGKRLPALTEGGTTRNENETCPTIETNKSSFPTKAEEEQLQSSHEKLKSIEVYSATPAQHPSSTAPSHFAPESSAIPTNTPNRSQKYCKHCGSIIDTDTKKCSGCGKQYFNAKKVNPVLFSVVLLSLSFCMNVVQYMSGKANTQEYRQLEEAVVSIETQIDEQKSDIAERKNTIAYQESTIDRQKIQIRDLKRKNVWFDDFLDGVTSGNLSYGSSNFYASESIIAIKKSDASKTFTVTMNWSGGGTVSVDSYNYSTAPALVQFENAFWLQTKFTTSNRTTTVTIEPQHAGVQIFTFRNDRNSDTFNVIVIVTD